MHCVSYHLCSPPVYTLLSTPMEYLFLGSRSCYMYMYMASEVRFEHAYFLRVIKIVASHIAMFVTWLVLVRLSETLFSVFEHWSDPSCAMSTCYCRGGLGLCRSSLPHQANSSRSALFRPERISFFWSSCRPTSFAWAFMKTASSGIRILVSLLNTKCWSWRWQEQSVLLKCATCGACCCEGSRSENTNKISEALAKERRCGTAYPTPLEGRYSVLEK